MYFKQAALFRAIKCRPFSYVLLYKCRYFHIFISSVICPCPKFWRSNTRIRMLSEEFHNVLEFFVSDRVDYVCTILSKIKTRGLILKVPKYEIDFWPIFFYTNTSFMGWWLEDWRRKNFFLKTTADIRHFVFFTQAEPALKIFLRRLSLR
jgi:hypothetical protein